MRFIVSNRFLSFLSLKDLFYFFFYPLTESAKAPIRQQYDDNHYPAVGDGFTAQKSFARIDQHLTDVRLPHDLPSLQNRYAPHYPPKKPDIFPKDNRNTKKYDFSGVYYSYITTRPPKSHANTYRHRRKRQRIKNKLHVGRHVKSRPVNQQESRSLDSSIALNVHRSLPRRETPYLSNSKVDSHSRVTRPSTPSGQTFPQKGEFQRDSEDVDKSTFKNVHHSHKSLNLKKQDEFQDDPAKLIAGLHRSSEPKAYSHDPFLNAPADRYDFRPSRERPTLETTTVLPHFVHGGSRPDIPDSFFLPGPTKVVAHEGGVALLPCGVKYLEMKEVRRDKDRVYK